MQRKFRLSLVALCFLVISCSSGTETTTPDADEPSVVDGHPGWIMQGNVYEVNVRQYTPEGTFNAFAKSLDRLKEMGVQTLWFMPINPISKVDRKGVLGSYYAVADYTAVNPEFGTMEDWKNLVKAAHDKGLKVIIDWVPNHTGADHHWLEQHQDFFIPDSITGKPRVAFDWDDTRDLNYDNPAVRDSMINSMKFWLTETGIDGFRCDVAWGVPNDFWKTCITELERTKPGIFMLAEADDPSYHEDGFDASYPWEWFNMTKLVAKGERPAFAIDSVLRKIDTTYPANAIKLFFTSNHDENSWNKADYATMPGAIHAPFAVLSQTLYRSVPLIYSGQEEPFLDSISFFYKDTISFGKFQRAPMYKTLLNLRKDHPALAANSPSRKVSAGDSSQVYAFLRYKDDDKVLVILNLSAKPAAIKVADADLNREASNVFNGNKENPAATAWNMEPWGYAVYVY